MIFIYSLQIIGDVLSIEFCNHRVKIFIIWSTIEILSIFIH